MPIRTITRLFESRAEAHDTVRALEPAGFQAQNISVLGPSGETSAEDQSGTDVGAAAAGGLPASLTQGRMTEAGLTEAEAETYAEGRRRGAWLVSLRAEEARLPQAETIFARHNAQLGHATLSASPTQGRMTEEPSRGMTSDPPGTMLSRGIDDLAGTNFSGARPENERDDGPGPGRPPGG